MSTTFKSITNDAGDASEKNDARAETDVSNTITQISAQSEIPKHVQATSTEPINVVDADYGTFHLADSDLEKIDKLVEEREILLSQEKDENDYQEGDQQEQQSDSCSSQMELQKSQPKSRVKKQRSTKETEMGSNGKEGYSTRERLSSDKDCSQRTDNILEQQQKQSRAEKNVDGRTDNISSNLACRKCINTDSKTGDRTSKKGTISKQSGGTVEIGTHTKSSRAEGQNFSIEGSLNGMASKTPFISNDPDAVIKGKKEEDELIRDISKSISDARKIEKKEKKQKKLEEKLKKKDQQKLKKKDQQKEQVSRSSSESSSPNEGTPNLSGSQKGVIDMLSPLFENATSNGKKKQNSTKSTKNVTTSQKPGHNVAKDTSKTPQPRTATTTQARSSSAASTEHSLQLAPDSSSFSSQRQVTSTSSKAGLSLIKNTKLKRLWPDSLVFAKRIMKWSPPTVIQKETGSPVRFQGCVRQHHVNACNLEPIPSSFRDVPDMTKHMTPHILEEGINSLYQEFKENSTNGQWTRHIFTLYLRSCTPVEPKNISSASVRLYEFAFHLKSKSTRPPTNLGEMFVIHSPSWKQSSCCLGYIGSNDINSTFLTDQKTDDEDSFDLCKLWISVSNTVIENSGWLSESDLPSRKGDGTFLQQEMFAVNIGTCTDMMRQYEALKSLECIKPNIKNAIFCLNRTERPSSSTIPETLTQPSKPSSVIADVWNKISAKTNIYQLHAIETIMLGKAKDNISLLQGPPGTGKTLTIVNLVGCLLNGSVPIPGAKNPRTAGTKIQIGKALSNSENKAPVLNVPVARRILICAPSNQAVDDLAWKLHKSAIGLDGRIGSFNILRFGMLPGEDRHDGRGRSNTRQRKMNYHSERDKFLYSINLDTIVNRIAEGREINDFAHQKEFSKKSPQAQQRHSRFINYAMERQKKLSRCHVICTTLSGAGSKAFAEAVSRDDFPQSEFDAVIIDEACQGSEMACLIPLKFNPNAVVLVGDPQQLPVLSFSREAKRCNADRSLFERLQQNGWPIHMLRYQYRMHEEIASFPSKMFYENLLKTSQCVQNRPAALWHHHYAFPPYVFWDVRGIMTSSKNGGLNNLGEAVFVCRMLHAFSSTMPRVRDISIGIITFYNEQVALINQKLDKKILDWMKRQKITLQVSTVDGFQGSEKDIIILSCVRSNCNDVGFLKDHRRVNVALTRAKHSLWILGNYRILQSNELWAKLLQDAKDRDLLGEASRFDDYFKSCDINSHKGNNNNNSNNNNNNHNNRSRNRNNTQNRKRKQQHQNKGRNEKKTSLFRCN